MDKLVAKINWSFNRWKGFDWEAFRRKQESGFEFVRKTGYAHEWWNFYEGFSPDKYYGSAIRRPQKFSRGFVLFISRNPLDNKWYLVGFYCDAVMPPKYASTGIPMRDLLPEIIIKDIEKLVGSSDWKDRHLAYLSQVLSGEEYRTMFVAPKECSASFLPEAYIEVHPEDIGVERVDGQWKITYRITRNQIEKLLEEAKRRHKVIDSEEAREIVRRIDRALKKLRETSIFDPSEHLISHWAKTYGPGKAEAVEVDKNGDIIVAGYIEKDSKDDGFVARLDANGNIKWFKTYGGNYSDVFYDLKIAPNGDIIVVGWTESFGAGGNDVWILRLDEYGNIKWEKTYGSWHNERANAIAIAPNGDIIVVGWTESFGAGKADFWLLRLDEDGNVKWQKTYGGSGTEWANTIAVAPNGDIIVVGYTDSFGAGGVDAWVLRLDENGNVKWQKTYGGSKDDEAYAVAVTPESDIIVAGYTDSFGAGKENVWVLRLDENGNVKWQKTYGGSGNEGAYEAAIALNGDIIVVGYTDSFGAGGVDAWVLRLDENGNVKWQKTYGGSKDDEAYAVAIAPNGDIIVTGYTESFDAGLSDIWVLRLPPDGNLPSCKICQNSNAIVIDTPAVVKNTNCKVTVPPLKPSFLRKKHVKIAATSSAIKTAMPKVDVLCKGSPKKSGGEAEKAERTKPCPGYLIDGRCYIVKTKVTDEAYLKSALEELDKELSSIDFIQPLPDKITVHPFKGIIEGENLFVTRNIVSRGPGESGIKSSKWLIEILDWIRNTVIPEIEVSENVSEGVARSLPETKAKKPEVKAKTAPKISKVPKVPEKAKPAEEIKTVEGFPSALLERYEPLEFLGEGGFARVYKAKRREDGKIVALKIPRIDERTGRFFIKEVASWYQLNHPNIVTLYEANVYPIPYIEMEFVEGVEVDGKLVRDLDKYPKPVDEKTALKLITGIARGLAHAHSKGIYHLDLKPLNVLLKADLRPKITDWGLAKISARSSLSRHYGYSPLYAAPEQLDEETFGVPDHRTDIYQLGLIFYELLTGELPYKATSPGALVGKILYAKPKPVSELKPGLKKFDGVFEKLLAKRKEERYQSVEEFLSALESLTELEREKEELRKTSLAMKKSRSREEFERLKVESIRKTVKIAILSAKLNDKAELLTALDDLKFYTHENLDDLMNAIAQIEMLLKEGIPISPEVEERVKALVLRIEGEALR